MAVGENRERTTEDIVPLLTAAEVREILSAGTIADFFTSFKVIEN